eukprot:TRINITY_DN6666_c0_g1_i2.p2 TRINITY_DN6666_c0_g1~~TRINITY_DN6666_c0_g1_i2.p2  ORF type:complete len:161 (+),score=29.54 TRINITY_DN6666_c0_g1_i2:360-842(+)
MDALAEQMRHTHGLALRPSDFLLKTSHGLTDKKGPWKHSWHLLLPAYHFARPSEQVALNLLVLERLKGKLEADAQLREAFEGVSLSEGEWKAFPDLSVYKSLQLFRLAESTKSFRFPRFFEIVKEMEIHGEAVPFEWTLESSFIGLYDGDTCASTLLPSL